MVARRQTLNTLVSDSTLSDSRPIPCVVMRGGTSRGLFFHEHDLPRSRRARNRVIMGAVGAPDPRQVDGLGGADMLLSKVAIVSCSMDSDVDVECEFANIAPGKEGPTYGTNCGNLVAAVALFAVDEGLVSPQYKNAPIRILNRNSGVMIEATIGKLARDLDDTSVLSGMSGSGVCVDLDFIGPVGTVQGTLLPTGSARDTYVMGDGRSVDVSVIDAGALYVFARAADLDLTAGESAHDLQANPAVRIALEHLRSMIAESIGLVDSAASATKLSPDVPKLAFIGPSGERTDVDLLSRIVSSQNYHQAYAVTGAIATAVASAVPGSVVEEVIGKTMLPGISNVRIGHPSGVLDCRFENLMSGKIPIISRAGLMRTARRVMQGAVEVPNACF